MPVSHRLYTDLAPLWPLLSPPEDHTENAALAMRLATQVLGRPPRSLLDLGSGGGAFATHLPDDMDVVLNDLSEAMLEVSRTLNPGREHVAGDMRTLKLDRTFDLVLLGDGVMYLTSAEDVLATLRVAAAHLEPGGALLVRPDAVVETFTEGSLVGGFEDADGRAAQLLEWHHSPERHRYRVDFAVLVREPDGAVECVHEQHWMGLFDRRTWWELVREAGFEPVAADLPWEMECGEVFLARRR
jgi:SAM-dependent methyltransferase